jgi:hypothetical protein
LSEFKKVFGLNLNFEFKYKKTTEKKLQSVSIFFLVTQFNLACVPLKPSCYFRINLYFPAHLAPSPLGLFQPNSAPYPSIHLQPVAPPLRCSPAPSKVTPSGAASTSTPIHTPSGSPPLGAVSSH